MSASRSNVVFVTRSRPGGGGSPARDRSLTILLLVFAALSFLTALFAPGGERVAEGQVSPGQSIGPFTIDTPDTVLVIRANASPAVNTWLFAEITLLDQNGDELIGFGKEYWYETGRDSDGPWSAAERDVAQKLVVREPGAYRIGLAAEAGRARGNARVSPPSPVFITVSTASISALPHSLLTFGFLALAGVAFVVNSPSRSFGETIGSLVRLFIFGTFLTIILLGMFG